MIRQKIEIRGLAEPGYERWIGPKSEAEIRRSQGIIRRLDEEAILHPNCHIEIRSSGGQFELIIKDEEDQIQEQRFVKAKEIYEKRGESAHRAEVRRAFLY